MRVYEKRLQALCARIEEQAATRQARHKGARKEFMARFERLNAEEQAALTVKLVDKGVLSR